jgi:serine/threonine protein kinase
MAHYPGVTLKQRLESGPLRWTKRSRSQTQVAKASAGAPGRRGAPRHQPSNLVLTDDMVKIVDFGLAKFADSVHLTASGRAGGTFAYMSPEQVRAEGRHGLERLLGAGRGAVRDADGPPPFRGHYSEAVAHAIRHESPVPIRSSRRKCPRRSSGSSSGRCTRTRRSGSRTGREVRARPAAPARADPATDVITAPVAVSGRPAWPHASTASRRRLWLAAGAGGHPAWRWVAVCLATIA